jgi:hypothetical protein
MATLLVLGSKPDPALPSADSYDAIACANASGRSAKTHGLRDPTFTVMSTILSSGHKAANVLALQALRGLRTETLYLYPRPPSPGHLLKRMVRAIKRLNVRPRYLERRLRAVGYHFERSIDWPQATYNDLALGLCGHDPEVAALIDRKQPSTGMMALTIGLADERFDRFIMSGFSFEITHAYAHNPLIDETGSTRSKHADTDIAILRCLSRRFGNIFTTETAVHDRAGVPLVQPGVAGESSRARAS